MFASTPFKKSLSPRQFLTLSLSLFITIFVIAWLGLYYVSKQMNQTELESEKVRIHYLLKVGERNTLNLAKDYALWDDMVERGILHPTPEFFTQNLRASDLYRTHFINQLLLLDAHLNIKFCTHRPDPEGQAQQTVFNADTCGLDFSLPEIFHLIKLKFPSNSLSLSGYLLDQHRQLYQMVVAHVRYQSQGVDTEKNRGYLVFFRPITEQALNSIAEGLDINDLRLNPILPGKVSYSFRDDCVMLIKNVFDQPISQLSWKSSEPGTVFYRKGVRFLIFMSVLILLSMGIVYLRLLRSQRILEDLNKEMAVVSQQDVLTGCLSRNAFMGKLTEYIEHQAGNAENQLAFIIIDIQAFKQINKLYGYHVGDEILQVVAELLKVFCEHKANFLCRYDANEFGLALINTESAEWLQIRLERLVKVLTSALSFPVHFPALNFYIGVSVFPDNVSTSQGLVQKAELSIQVAKQKNVINYPQFFDSLLMKSFERLETVERLLETALEDEEFYLVFQPFVVSKGMRCQQRVCGAETLLRWCSATIGEVYPDEFIPAAEKSQHIEKIEHWVLEKALSQYHVMAAIFGEDFHLSINLSPITIQNPNLIEILLDLQNRYPFPPGHIHLEITERILINETHGRLLNRIQEQGYLISLDDFGTGYSALSYLTNMNLDVLKIDKSFVDKILLGMDADKHILEAIITIAKALGMQIVAEGVEELEQVAFLQARDVDCIQGYFYSKPKRLDEFLSLPSSFN